MNIIIVWNKVNIFKVIFKETWTGVNFTTEAIREERHMMSKI